MALRPCLNCDAMISPYARRCPQCGEPSPHATPRQKAIGFGIVIVIAIGMLALITYKQSESEKEFRDFKRRFQKHEPQFQ